jgi:hypothetical protein
MLDTTFVAAVLEGLEGTLQELIGRVGRSDLRGRLATLQDETATPDRLPVAVARWDRRRRRDKQPEIR